MRSNTAASGADAPGIRLKMPLDDAFSDNDSMDLCKGSEFNCVSIDVESLVRLACADRVVPSRGAKRENWHDSFWNFW